MAPLTQSNLKREFDRLRKSLTQRAKEAGQAFPQAESNRRKERGRELLRFLEIYLPHYMPDAHYSEFHVEFSNLSNPLAHGARWPGLRLVLAAPRGNGKTTLLKALILQMLCLERKKFILLISDSVEQAAETLEAVKLELEENPRLAVDFPNAVGAGDSWSAGQVVTNHGAKVKAFGTGKRIRGASHGVQRPDLIILDDLENDEQVATPAGRDKLD